MGTEAKVIADSVGPAGKRVTTMEVEMHRFVLAEFNTHRVFSRNSASSRAIPVVKQLNNIWARPAYPAVWASEKPGMQGGDELTGVDREDAEALFQRCLAYVGNQVELYVETHPLDTEESVRLHKSLLNRLLEPFMWHKVIVTSTEWDNFFALRCHPLAQPEMRIAAEMMFEAYHSSIPTPIGYGEWHTPYADERTPINERLITSVARCAWVSTSSHDGDHSFDACVRMYNRLAEANPMHASPFEHQCSPMMGHEQVGNLIGFRQLRHMVEKGQDIHE